MCYLNRLRQVFFIFLLHIPLLSVNAFAANEDLIFDFKIHSPLELAPYNTQLLLKFFILKKAGQNGPSSNGSGLMILI